LDFRAGSGTVATENDGAWAGGAAEELDAVSVASVLEIDSTFIVVDLRSASMAMVESDCARAFILNAGAACGAVVIKDDRSAKIRVMGVVASGGAAAEY
jgi:hypothetical protein